MELEELKNVWKRQKTPPRESYSPSELMMIINNKMISFEDRIRSRDRLEIIACIVVIVFFGIYFFVTDSLWQQAGSVVLVAACFFIWYKLRATDLYSLEERPLVDLPMSVHLERELERVKEQKKLLERIAWWYLLPMVLGLLIFSVGFRTNDLAKVLYMITVVGGGYYVWHLNQRSVKRRFEPLIRELEEALRYVKENE